MRPMRLPSPLGPRTPEIRIGVSVWLQNSSSWRRCLTQGYKLAFQHRAPRFGVCTRLDILGRATKASQYGRRCDSRTLKSRCSFVSAAGDGEAGGGGAGGGPRENGGGAAGGRLVGKSRRHGHRLRRSQEAAG